MSTWVMKLLISEFFLMGVLAILDKNWIMCLYAFSVGFANLAVL